MSYVDLIIKYLSGDLNQEETSSFEQELASNEELRREYEEVSAAYQLIRDQLQSQDEAAFRKKLKEVINRDEPKAEPRNKWFSLKWIVPLAAACCLAMIYLFTIHKPGNDKLLSRFYDPFNDPVVLAYQQETRGTADPGIRLYLRGDYQESMEILSLQIEEEPGDKLLQLYCLLSSIELDRQDEVIPVLHFSETDSMYLPDQALAWYTTLALLKSDRREEALELLLPLCEQAGPYQAEASKMKKVLLK